MTKIIKTLLILGIGTLPTLSTAKPIAPLHHNETVSTPITSAAVAKLEALMANQQYQEAYAYAQMIAPRESGNPKFDFLYGGAALYSNHPSEAIFALERARITNPSDQNILFVLGNAYLKQKNLNSAEATFKKIKNNPQAQPYLNQIAILKDKKRTSWYLKYAIEGGYDNNVDGLWKFGIPSGHPSWFNNFTLTPGFIRKLSDNKSAIFGFVALRYRPTYNIPRLSIIETNATAGYTTKLGDFRLNIPVHVAYMSVGNQPFANNVGIVGEISKPLDKKRVNVLTGKIDFEHFEYPRKHIRDSNQTIFIGEWDWHPLKKHFDTKVKAYYSAGKALDITKRFLIRNYYGAEITANWNGLKKQTPYITLIYINSDFQGVDPKYKRIRNDNFYTFKAGWAYHYSPTLTIEPMYSFNNSDSSLPLYNYHRHLFQIAFKGQFNG